MSEPSSSSTETAAAADGALRSIGGADNAAAADETVDLMGAEAEAEATGETGRVGESSSTESEHAPSGSAGTYLGADLETISPCITLRRLREESLGDSSESEEEIISTEELGLAPSISSEVLGCLL